jgi:5'-3' exonuclease
MLCQIPGISSVTALAIIEKYKSISNLIISLNNDENCLKDISYVNTKEQSRKISKTSIQNIIKFLIKK